MLEKTLESPLDCKEIQPVSPKGNQSWILIGKDPDAGKDWRQEEKGVTEDEMVGWHHWLNGHEFEQASGDEGQGSLACYSPRGSQRVRHDLVTEKVHKIYIHTNIHTSNSTYLTKLFRRISWANMCKELKLVLEHGIYSVTASCHRIFG